MTVVFAPAARLPPEDDSVTQDCALDAVQLIDWPPVFDNVNDWLEGLNGPPAVPEELRDPEDTDSAPAGTGADTVKDFAELLTSPCVEPLSFEFPNQAA